ncbi:glycosyltransferase family 32 protein [Aspergillus puulaauensis]|uniref:Nucleotide-diphospho-sugar transferase n=1 Tax=Aspergillus puulaauensis TaxID=1220207 RepID=A0A7R7XR30_9EURO|nr:uncharacterized protein APUU_50134A [Aspergillus puulaauensis]BCS25423.1 hypothetical protein APUU_50134A [Aspergillus puulaauensis]
MRRSLLVFLLVALVIIFLLIRSVWTLLSLLIEDGSADAIHRAEMPRLNSSFTDQRPQTIPKIIHQTYKNETIPDIWIDAQQSCVNLHPDYEYILWTDAKSRQFIAAEYPWFLETFDGYRYPIQRADSIRYFVLAHYGGTYIDLDDGCNRPLDTLLTYPAWVRRTVPTGISNDAMGSVPQHPFFLKVIKSLQQYDRHWVLPYITVMYSTGPLFLSVIWKEYMKDFPSEISRVRILMPDEYMNHSWSFFTHHTGNSWHRNDARFIFWMGQHWQLVTLCGFLFAAAAVVCVFWTYTQIMLLRDHATVSSGLRSSSRRSRYMMPSLLWRGSSKGGDDIETLCELERRDD